MIDPLLGLAIDAGFALLLATAAGHKAASHARFASALGEYRLLPAAWVPAAAWCLPAMEAVLAIAWATSADRSAVAAATTVLLLVYAAAIAANLGRGRVHIACGCGLAGSSAGDAPLSWWLVARNLVLAAVAAGAALPRATRDLAVHDWLILAAALATAVLLYAGISQLLQNGAAVASWRTQRD